MCLYTFLYINYNMKLRFSRRTDIKAPVESKAKPPEPLVESISSVQGELRQIGEGAILRVELNEGQMLPKVLEISGEKFHLYELREDKAKRQYGIIYDTMCKIADKIIAKYGIPTAFKLAKLSSKVDIATSYFVFSVVGLATTANIGMYIIKPLNKTGVSAEKISKATETISNNYQKMTGEACEIICQQSTTILTAMGVIAAGLLSIVAIWATIKRILDQGQTVLLNRVREHIREHKQDVYQAYVDEERHYREAADAEKIANETIGDVLTSIPVLGAVLHFFIKEYNNIRFEKKQLRAIEVLERLALEKEN